MLNDVSQSEKFKELLDQEHTWPGDYQFKFILKKTELETAQSLFPTEQITLRESESGKYISVTFSKKVASSDEVLMVYKKASMIPGVMAL